MTHLGAHKHTIWHQIGQPTSRKETPIYKKLEVISAGTLPHNADKPPS